MAGFLASLIPALLQGVAGGLGGGSAAPQQPIDAGVQSAMGQTAPAALQENPTGGSTFKDLLNKGISQGVASLVGARVNRWQAKNAGQDSRAYLESQFPGLNPWELAGVGASDAGVGLSGQDTQQQMQDKELKTRIGMQEQQIGFGLQQLAAQERMNQVSAAAGIASASIGAGPGWAAIPSLEMSREAEAEAARARANASDADAAYRLDENKRAWASSLINALMSGYSANAGVAGGDSTFKRDALGALAASSVASGVGSLIQGGGAGKLWNWVSKFTKPKGSASNFNGRAPNGELYGSAGNPLPLDLVE